MRRPTLGSRRSLPTAPLAPRGRTARIARMSAKDGETLEQTAARVGVPATRRHIFLCVGPTCCTPEQGAEVWAHLKARLKQVYPDLAQAPVYRTKASCLRIVYPEGTWYRGLDLAAIDRVIDEHLIGGRPVEALRFAECELRAGPCPRASTSEDV